MRKIFSFCFCLVYILIFLFTSVSALNIETDFEIKSDVVFMINTDSDVIVYEKNIDKRVYPASLVKIMTAIIALENVKDLENTMVTAHGYIYDEFVGISVSNADIKRGEIVSMKDLLYSMILQSACESASIIADYISGGDIPKFVSMMNEKAKSLGALNTNFVNAHGLASSTQYTTARDMYIITKYALTLPLFEQMATTVKYEMQPTNKHTVRFVYHTNIMLDKARGGKYYYKYMKGIKTGTTDESGRNLISTASKDGYNYMLITMGAPLKDDNGKNLTTNFSYTDAINLYDWAFKNYKFKKVLSKDTSVSEVKVKLSTDVGHVLLSPEKDILYLLQNNIDVSTIQKIINIPEYVKAPISKGQVIGEVELKFRDEALGKTNLIATDNVKSNFILVVLDIISIILNSIWFKIILGLIIVIIIAYILIVIRYRNNNYKSIFKTKR